MTAPTVTDVVAAWNAIDEARRRYAQTLRDALAGDVTQAEVAQALGRSREKLRQDVMDDRDRERMRRADAERKRRRRAGETL